MSSTSVLETPPELPENSNSGDAVALRASKHARNSDLLPFPRSQSNITILAIASALFTAFYAWLFVDSVSLWWFHPGWTTDDAIQQVYPFHEVKYPGVFNGDLITEVMKGYLAPLHYWICYGVTVLVENPIMMSHWVMLLQVVITLGFLFAAVRSSVGAAPAFFAVAWLLHTRHVMQRLTGGLPRGWAACVFAAFLYFALTKNHRGVIATILLGCLLNPPSAFLIATAYGLILVAGFFTREGRAFYGKRILTYALSAPLIAAVAFAVVHRPVQVGQMVTFEEASQMPEFQRANRDRPNGRFPFLPFREPWDEVKVFGFQAFVNRFYTPDPFIKNNIPWMVLGVLGVLVAGSLVRRREVIPREVLLFGVGAVAVYFASRLVAFKLYVPDRHIQFPFAFFFITAFTIGVWKLLHLGKPGTEKYSGIRKAWLSGLGLFGMAGLVYWGSAAGLQGSANFNYSIDRKGGVFEWLHANTPQMALVAGHPTHLDGVQLFAVRRGYVSTETTHPFYTRYYAEMKRRSEIVFRAHYATDLGQFLSLVEPESIEYFVFKRSEFTREALSKATYFSPLDILVRQLARQQPESYAYFTFSKAADEGAAFVPYKDKQSVVVDVKRLREFVDSQRRE